MSKPLMDRHYRDAGDVLIHVREQAAILTFRVNQGRAYTDEQFAQTVRRVYQVMVTRLIANLVASGRTDLADKVQKARDNRWFVQDMADLKRVVRGQG